MINWIKGCPPFGEIEKWTKLLLALDSGEKVISHMVDEGNMFEDHEGYTVTPEEIKAYAVINEPKDD